MTVLRLKAECDSVSQPYLPDLFYINFISSLQQVKCNKGHLKWFESYLCQPKASSLYLAGSAPSGNLAHTHHVNCHMTHQDV